MTTLVTPFRMRLVSSRMLAPRVRHFTFERLDGVPFAFLPGQFLQIHFRRPDGTQTRRSYSIANISDETCSATQTIEIAVAYVEGGAATSMLACLDEGESIDASGPHGRFCLSEGDANQRYILVATGTGVTPYRSMMPQLRTAMQRRNARVALVQGARNEAELLYGDVFEAVAQEDARFSYYACFSQTQRHAPRSHDRSGRVHVAIDELRPFAEGDIAYLCGHPRMVEEAFDSLRVSGMRTSQIRREKYISPR